MSLEIEDAREKLQRLVDLEFLSVKEKKIFELRYGLDGGKKWTLEEVGKMFGVTRERVRQIEEKVKEKISKTYGTIN